ncbi:hypothetical protein LCGC14_1481310 [marine sediment metagenome]|uniref:Uncharacterized protein n=2 Tax=root TaxID=1 RepID=A0A831QK96_9FLAO|nr:hypothetical protein [Pricia sp.]HEA19820.1 hypothetical protein [Pricia antarctica]
MNDENIRSKSAQAKKVEEFYHDCQHWKSKLWFIEDEAIFLEHLLNSYVFEPKTPNLFERLQDYLERLKKAETTKTAVIRRITVHEKTLSGMFDCKDMACNLSFYQKHNAIQAEVVGFVEDFGSLKAEIFNYARWILKKSKPHYRHGS